MLSKTATIRINTMGPKGPKDWTLSRKKSKNPGGGANSVAMAGRG